MGWPKYEASSDNRRHILRIGPYKKHKNTEIITSIIHEDRAEKCAFWNQLFPKLLKATDLECQNKHQLFEENIKYLPVQGRDAQLENESRNAPLRSPMQDSSLSSSIAKLKDVSRNDPLISSERDTSPDIEKLKHNQMRQEIKDDLKEIQQKYSKTTKPKIRTNNKYETSTFKYGPKDNILAEETLPPTLNSLKNISPLHSDTPTFKMKKLKNQFINDIGTKVSFRMNVKHQSDQENWNFYQSTEAGDDPVVIFEETSASSDLISSPSSIASTKSIATTSAIPKTSK